MYTLLNLKLISRAVAVRQPDGQGLSHYIHRLALEDGATLSFKFGLVSDFKRVKLRPDL